MNDKSTNSFKIRLDDNVADHDDVEKSRPRPPQSASAKQDEAPSRNWGWVLYLLIVLLIGAMSLGYFDIRNRLLSVHSTGSLETQHVSEDLESKFSSLSIKLSTIEESIGSLSEGQTALTGSFSTMKDDLASANKSISAVKSSKADKTSTGNSLENIKKDLSSLSESVKKNIADSAVMSAKLNATLTDLNALSTNTTEKISALKALLEALETQKASKKELLTEIDHLENVINANQSQSGQQLTELNNSLQRLISRVRALETNAGVKPSSQDPVVTQPKSSSSANATESAPSLLEPGELIERDISQ